MSVNWDDLQKEMSPIKEYEDFQQRWQESFAYPFIRVAYNFTMPELIHYTELILGGDSRGRYGKFTSQLVGLITQLYERGISNLLDLLTRIDTREKLELFVAQSGIQAHGMVVLLKYLIYWVIPSKKYLSGLVRDDPTIRDAIQVLGLLGVRTNLDLLQQGITVAGRRELAETSDLPESVIYDLVNRADFSRMPWASKATISNIIGAGYGSIAQLAEADPEQLYADFFAYGKAIGKNLKLGNEIESSYRIAKILPVILQE